MKNVERSRKIKEKEAPGDTLRRIVNLLFSLAGFLLVFRFVFLLFGANPDNRFVDVIYSITGPYVGIFHGIFSESEWESGVFEPATIIAMVVLFIVSWFIQSLFARRTVRKEQHTTSERSSATDEGVDEQGRK